MSGHFIDLEGWPRRAHYEFFSGYSNPFFSVTVQLEATPARVWCRENDRSFFLATLFLATAAANEVEAFRLRIRDGGVWLHDRVRTGSTVLRDDETFGFCYFEDHGAFAEFEREGRDRIEAVRSAPPGLRDEPERDDLIYFSVLPWIAFTAFSHAARYDSETSVPRIVIGKLHGPDASERLPVSVDVHHGLADGLHVGQFLEHLQARLSRPETHLES